MIDLWTIVHFATWIFIGSTIEALWPCPWWVHLSYGIAASAVWEAIEYPLQRKYPAKWSNRIESHWNAFLIDPVSNLFGLLVGVLVVYYYRM